MRWQQQVERWLEQLKPGRELQQGMVIWLVGLALAAAAFAGYGIESGLGAGVDILAGLLLGVAGVAISLFVAWLGLQITRRLPWMWLGALVAAAAALSQAIYLNLEYAYPLWLAALALTLITGWAWGQVFGQKRRWLWPVLLLALGLDVSALAWVANDGSTDHLLQLDLTTPHSFTLNLPDPGQPGPYEVQFLTYGSGTDPHRPEFGDEVDIITTAISVGQFMGLAEGIERESREWFWGFGPAAFPRNARVWYPVGDGLFPLVLIMHGNHNMVEFSEAGYDYLGEHLASHGYIFASVDANFFNGYFTGSIGGENDARAWMLLKHLELWQEWNQDNDNLFHDKVNMEQIALIGHSRGGEAVAVAAAFNNLTLYPDNANIRLGTDYGIRAIVAIAPTDQQYKPTDQPLPLENINYLVLQGSHDSDVSTFSGLRQYQRITFTDEGDWFKAALYIYRANHGQFNTVWGATDFSWPRRIYLNTAALLPAEDQQQVAKVMITAFLNTTLRHETAYRLLFEDWRYAAAWLPDTYFVNQYEDNRFRLLADFEEDVDVTTASVDSGQIQAWGLNTWREDEMTFRNNTAQENQAVRLGWSSTNSWYELTLPDGWATDLTSDDVLVFAAADASTRDHPLDFSIILTDASGSVVSLPLSQFGLLLPQFPVEHTRWPLYEKARYKNEGEAILQTFQLKLGVFAAANTAFDPATLHTIRFRFDQSQAGEIYLDRIGFLITNNIHSSNSLPITQ